MSLWLWMVRMEMGSNFRKSGLVSLIKTVKN